MEATVRYIPIDTAVVDGQEFSVGNKPALCFRGKTYALGIVNGEEGIAPIRLTLRDHDQSPLIMINNQMDEYPVVKFITHLERMMQDKPISPQALELIKTWPNTGEDFDSKPLPDEAFAFAPKGKTKKPNCIPSLASEYKTTPQKVRKFLRSKGMHAPYSDEKGIRKLMKSF